jgi:hypothetical protein
MAGNTAHATDIMGELAASPICNESRAFYTALVAAAAGDKPAAARWVAESLQRRDHLVPLFVRSSSFELLRGEESYGRRLIRRSRLRASSLERYCSA